MASPSLPAEVEWHLKNKMPRNPTLDQRLKWHVEHARNCSCPPSNGEILRSSKSDT